MRTPEGRLKDKVKAFLKARGAYYHMPVQNGYGQPSLDFVGCYKGFYFAIETKAPGKTPTPRQTYTMNEIVSAEGTSIWNDTWEGGLERQLIGMFDDFDERDALISAGRMKT